MSTTYRIGPANVLVASALTDPVSSWRDFGLTRGNAVLDLNARDLALLRADQEKTPLADAAYITPSPNSVRFLLTDYQLSNLLDVFPGSVQLTASAKTALATAGLPHSTAKLSPKSWAIVPSREYSDDLFFLDSPSVVWFEYAFARVDAIVAGNAIEDTDDALASTAYEITLTRVIPNSSGIGNPLLSGKSVQGVLFAWQPSIDALTPLIGQGPGTFTRATTATYIDANGTIQSVASGQPRYQDGGLLLEPQRTNLVTRSQEFDNASWSKPGTGTVTANNDTAPDGTATADLLQSATGVDNRIEVVIAVSSSTTYTATLYVKLSSGSGVAYLQMRDASTGTTPTGATVTGTHWQRVKISITTGVATSLVNFRIYTDGSDVHIWGAQLEAGSYPTSYIPTSGSTVTRNADGLSFAYSTPITSDGLTALWKGVEKSGTDGFGFGLHVGGILSTDAGEFILFARTNGRVSFIAPGGIPEQYVAGATNLSEGIEDDIVGVLDYASNQVFAYDSSDVAISPVSVSVSGGMIPADSVVSRPTSAPSCVMTAMMISKGSLTPAQLRRILR